MAVVLLDTTVASLFHPKKNRDTRRKLYAPEIIGKVCVISFQTVAELWRWPEKNNWGELERLRFDEFVRRFVVVAYDYQLARAWAKVTLESQRQGRKLESGDAWIAATAIHRGIPLVTHDRDFSNVELPGLQVISHPD
jgi:tRNA(fMet)-specific endonuclease VapC